MSKRFFTPIDLTNTVASVGELFIYPITYAANQSGGIYLQDKSAGWSAGWIKLISNSGGVPRLGVKPPDHATEVLSVAYNKIGINTVSPNETLSVVGTASITSNTFIGGNLTVDTNTLYIDSVNNKVGIGTTSPNSTLTVTGSAVNDSNSEIRITSSAGWMDFHNALTAGAWNGLAQVGDKGIIFSNDNNANTGALVIAPWANNPFGIRISAAASTTTIGGNLNVDSGTFYVDHINNRVGIGTTAPNATLHVIAASTIAPSLTFGANAGQILRNEGSEFAFGLSNSGPYPLWIQGRNTFNAAKDLAIQPLGGNVGIGTSNPGAALTVNGTASLIGTNTFGPTTFYDHSGINFSGTDYNEGGQINLLGGSTYKSMHLDNYLGNLRILYNSGNSLAVTVAQSNGSVYMSSSLNVTGTITSNIFSGPVIDSNTTRILFPSGATYSSASSTISGAIKIVLPTSRNNSGTMMRMTVEVYSYETGKSHIFRISGYNYGLGNWYNVSATQIGDSNNVPYNVRFGYQGTAPGTEDVIWIGEINSAWAYPKVTVLDFEMGHDGANVQWASGWSISLVQAFDTVEQTRACSVLWGSNNDGTGSGLDADLLDGQHGSYYLDTSSTAQTKSGALSITSTLTAAGSIKIDSSTAANQQIAFWDGASYFGGIGTDKAIRGTGTSTDIALKADTSRAIRFFTGGANERVVIDSTGKVGIGISTLSSMLHIVSSASTTRGLIVQGAANQSANLQEWQDSAGSNFGYVNNIGDVIFASKLLGFRYGRFGDDTGYTDATTLRVTAVATDVPTAIFKAKSAQTANLQEWHNSSGSVLTAIDSAGKLGIGTASPTKKFEINNNGSSSPPLRISSSNDGVAIEFVPNSIRYNWIIGPQQNVSNAFEITPSSFVGGTTYSTPAIVILNDGKIGIGSNTPASALHVVGGALVTGNASVGGTITGTLFGNSSSATISASSVISSSAAISNHASTASSIAGSLVTGYVASATVATHAGTASSIAGSLVTGYVASATVATHAGTASSINASLITGTLGTANGGTGRTNLAFGSNSCSFVNGYSEVDTGLSSVAGFVGMLNGFNIITGATRVLACVARNQDKDGGPANGKVRLALTYTSSAVSDAAVNDGNQAVQWFAW